MTQQVPLSQVKPGEFVRLSPSETAPVWIRGEYDRSTKRYCLDAWADVGRSTPRKGTALVYVGFTF